MLNTQSEWARGYNAHMQPILCKWVRVMVWFQAHSVTTSPAGNSVGWKLLPGQVVLLISDHFPLYICQSHILPIWLVPLSSQSQKVIGRWLTSILDRLQTGYRPQHPWTWTSARSNIFCLKVYKEMQQNHTHKHTHSHRWTCTTFSHNLSISAD